MAAGSRALHQDISKVLYSEEDLLATCQELGKKIAKDYANKEPLFLVTLSGAYVFAADLLRQVQPTPVGINVDFLRASSYGRGTESSGVVSLQVQSNLLHTFSLLHLTRRPNWQDSGRSAWAVARLHPETKEPWSLHPDCNPSFSPKVHSLQQGTSLVAHEDCTQACSR
jgi:hypothetical protein